MPAVYDKPGRFAGAHVHGVLFLSDGGRGFDDHAEDHGHTVGNAAVDAAVVVGARMYAFAGQEGVVGFAAAHGGKAEAGTEGQPLDGRHGEDVARYGGFDIVVEVGSALSCGQVQGKAFDDAAHGIALGARFENGLLHGFAARIVHNGKVFPARSTQCLHIGPRKVEGNIRHSRRFFYAGENFHALLPEQQLGHGPGKDERSREAAGKVPPAPVILETLIAQMGGEVRMTGPCQIPRGGVVARAGVGIFNDAAQGGAAGSALEHAAQYLYAVRFFAVCCYCALSWAPPVEFVLDEVFLHEDYGHEEKFDFRCRLSVMRSEVNQILRTWIPRVEDWWHFNFTLDTSMTLWLVVE